MRLRVEFTTEPFDLDEAAHALVAREVIEAAELDAVDVGPFGNTAEGDAGEVLTAVDALLRRALEAGCHPGLAPAQRDRGERTMTGMGDEPFITAVKPLVDAMGGEMVPPDEAGPDDVVLAWEGADVVAVRLPQLADSLDHILAAMERKQGKPLADLDRKTKQEVVRVLEARGAFSVRHGVETVAGALGVSRFTVYNYLNREKDA